MENLRGYKFKAYPNKKQIAIIEDTFYLYNRAWNKLLSSYVNSKEELNLIPFVEQNAIFKYFTKDPIGSKNFEIRNEMYFNGHLDYLVRNQFKTKGKNEGQEKSYNFNDFFKNENGDYHEPYNRLPSMVLDQVIITLKTAFNKMKDGSGFPKFKSYDKISGKVIGESSFQFRYTNLNQKNDEYRFIYENNKIGFHSINIGWGGKITITDIKGNQKRKQINFGKLKIKQHRFLPEDHLITGYVISRDIKGDYYISFTIKTNENITKIIDPKTRLDIIGVDRNAVGNHITTSNLELNQTPYNNELLFDKSENEIELYKQLVIDQRQLSKIRINIGIKLYGKDFITKPRKIPFDQLTKKYFLQKNKVSKLNNKIRNKKKDKINNIAAKLSDSANIIVFEDLKISNMIATPKPKTDENGNFIPNGRKRKAGLNRVISRSNLYEIMNKTKQKSKEKNCIVVEVPAHYTSRTCPICNHVNMDVEKHKQDKKLKIFVCQNCTHTDHSDFTAAQMIKNKYIEGLAIESKIQ